MLSLSKHEEGALLTLRQAQGEEFWLLSGGLTLSGASVCFSARRIPGFVGMRNDIGDQIVRHLAGQQAGIVPGHRIADKVGKCIDPPSLPYLIERRPCQWRRLASAQIVGMTRPADGVERVLALQGVAGRHGPAGAEGKLFRGRSCRRRGDDQSHAAPEGAHPNLIHTPPRFLIQPAGKVASGAAQCQSPLMNRASMRPWRPLGAGA